MQKSTLSKIVYASSTILALCVFLTNAYADNKFVSDIVRYVTLASGLTMFFGTIALAVRWKSDKNDPQLAKAPPLPTFGTVLKKSFLYILLPGVVLTAILFAIMFALGWQQPTR